MAYTPSEQLQALMNQYAQMQDYTPLTAEQLQQQGANRYQSVYDQQRLAAQQAYESTNAALGRQLAGLGTSYDRQREITAENYARSYSNANRQTISRGMQRSSYNNANLANISAKGNEAIQDINTAQTRAEGDIAAQQTMLAQQLAGQLSQFTASQQADILAYVDQMTQQEYERDIQNQNSIQQLAAQIYQFQQQEQQAALQREQWEREFAEQQRQFNAANSRRTTSSSRPAVTPPAETPLPTNGFSTFMSNLFTGLQTFASNAANRIQTSAPVHTPIRPPTRYSPATQ